MLCLKELKKNIIFVTTNFFLKFPYWQIKCFISKKCFNIKESFDTFTKVICQKVLIFCFDYFFADGTKRTYKDREAFKSFPEKTEIPENRSLKRELRNLVVDFANETTLHGFFNFVKPRSKFNPYKMKNMVYLLAILSCAALSGFNLYTLVQDYMEHPVATSIVIEKENQQEFPAVTICNCNPHPVPEGVSHTRDPRFRLKLGQSGTKWDNFMLIFPRCVQFEDHLKP